MRKFYLFPIALAVALLSFGACAPDEVEVLPELQPKLPSIPFQYSGPSTTFHHGNEIIFIPSEIPGNPTVTNAGAALGRVLFYDSRLSLNNRISCSSCHHQDKAFADGRAVSPGFKDQLTTRNSMAIVNIGLHRNLFWDSRVHNVRDLVGEPIRNHIEMGMEDFSILEAKLARASFYGPLFQAAYGTPAITRERIIDALAQFLLAIVSDDSRFDRSSTSSLTSPGLTAIEELGKSLFFSPRTSCARCHAGQNFAAPDFPGGEYGALPGGVDRAGAANTGLELSYRDPGLGNGHFRIPTLRNIAVTGPYMHDGRFATLEEVIDFYDHGMQAHPHLDTLLRDNNSGQPRRLGLTPVEKKALVAFLHTLTDQTMLTHPKYSDPFK